MAEHKPIGGGLAFALVALALVTDGLQALLTLLIVGVFLNPIINFFVAMIFTAMLASHGGGVVKRRAIAMVITTIGEFFPVVNALPLWTAFATYTIVVDKIQNAMHEDPNDPHNWRPPTRRTWRI